MANTYQGCRVRALLMLLIALSMTAVSLCSAQLNDIYHTGGLVNGRWWQTISMQAKSIYATGLNDGIGVALLRIPPSEQRAALVKEYTPKGFIIADVVREIDAIYGNTANVRIPVAMAFEYSLAKLNGMSKRDAELRLEHLRQDASMF